MLRLWLPTIVPARKECFYLTIFNNPFNIKISLSLIRRRQLFMSVRVCSNLSSLSAYRFSELLSTYDLAMTTALNLHIEIKEADFVELGLVGSQTFL